MQAHDTLPYALPDLTDAERIARAAAIRPTTQFNLADLPQARRLARIIGNELIGLRIEFDQRGITVHDSCGPKGAPAGTRPVPAVTTTAGSSP